MSNEKVAFDVALAEWYRWVEAMGLTEKVTRKTNNVEDLASLEDVKHRMLVAIQIGSLSINESGEAVFTPTSGNTAPITFPEPTGTDVQAMDRYKKDHAITKLHGFLASVAKQPLPRFQSMKKRDLDVCEAIGVLFLAS
jgi:hypothetical protein